MCFSLSATGVTFTGTAAVHSAVPAADGSVWLTEQGSNKLGRWDPVTILFDTPRGPADGGPEDRPERIVTVDPPKPGAWTWLGPNTLQFRPAEPWEPLRREVFTLDGAATTLVAPEKFSDHPSSAWFGAWYVSEVMDILTQNPEK